MGIIIGYIAAFILLAPILAPCYAYAAYGQGVCIGVSMLSLGTVLALLFKKPRLGGVFWCMLVLAEGVCGVIIFLK